jgi:hypothetical protein
MPEELNRVIFKITVVISEFEGVVMYLWSNDHWRVSKCK